MLPARLIKLLAAALLALCAAAPALAEIGCAADAAAHFAETLNADADATGGEHQPGGGDGGDAADSERDSHCAFGHGHGALMGAPNEPVAVAGDARFDPLAQAALASMRPPGPDRPPRA